MPESFVELEHVTVMRGSEAVLHDLALCIAPGECVAVLGPNGCGKSTLLKTLTCELYPVVRPGMRVSLFGRTRWDVSELRRRMGLVPSEAPVRDALDRPGLEIVLSGFFSAARLWPNLSVTDAMHELARRAMLDCGVAGLAKQALGRMSSGQQKRVMIARALAASGEQNAAGRRVLLLDEASNALDIPARRELGETVQRLAGQGTGIVMVTHHVEEIVPAIGRVVLMKNGHIVGDGAAGQMLTGERLSSVFGEQIELTQNDGRYYAR